MKTLTIALALMSLFAGSCTAADTNIVVEPVENGQTAGLENNDENKTEDMTNPFNFETKTVKLNSGWEMPIIGIGTYLLSTSQAEESVYNALKVGMRLIDTADIYGNEVGVGRGIARAMKDFGIKREEIFVTSKLWTSSFANADYEVDERLERLGLEYIDLLLLHHTAANDEHAYQAMERGVKAGKIHSIGISNFYEADVDRIMKIATIKPAVLQNETHPYRQSKDVKAHIAPLGTILESWFPLGGRGTGIRTLNSLDILKGVAAKYDATPAQIQLAWELAKKPFIVPIPGTTRIDHLDENLGALNINLSREDVEYLDRESAAFKVAGALTTEELGESLDDMTE